MKCRPPFRPNFSRHGDLDRQRPRTVELAVQTAFSCVSVFLCSLLLRPALSHALQGDCGQPASSGSRPSANDALYTLRAAVGVNEPCALSICDVDNNGLVTAADALKILRAAVGLAEVLNCPSAVTTTTARPSTTTSTGFPTTTTVLVTTTTIPRLGARSCLLDESSRLVFDLLSLENDLPLQGNVDIECGGIESDANTASCSCEIGQTAAVRIGGLGLILCLRSLPGCAPGLLRCDGSSVGRIDVAADHNMGVCTSNDDCQTQCQASCSGKGEEYLLSGCEGFCAGGSRDDESCSQESDCPGDSCNGIEFTSHGNICTCQCFRKTSPEAVFCNLGVSITLEESAPCFDGEESVLISEQCVPLTTGTAKATIADADNVSGTEIAVSDVVGGPITCTDFATGLLSDLRLVAAIATPDGPVGDLVSTFSAGCQ